MDFTVTNEVVDQLFIITFLIVCSIMGTTFMLHKKPVFRIIFWITTIIFFTPLCVLLFINIIQRTA